MASWPATVFFAISLYFPKGKLTAKLPATWPPTFPLHRGVIDLQSNCNLNGSAGSAVKLLFMEIPCCCARLAFLCTGGVSVLHSNCTAILKTRELRNPYR